MKLQAAGLALAPLLIAQGRRVRRVALRLPEAEGARQGSAIRSVAGADARATPAVEARTLRVLILGDSSAAGVGASTQADALTGRLPEALLARAEALAIDRVDWRLAARTGATAAEVLVMLDALAGRSFELAVVAVGVNDVTGRTPLRRWLRTIEHLVGALHGRHGVRCVVLSGLPPMHRFPLLPQPLRWYLGEHARQFDQALARWVVDRSLRLQALAETAEAPASGGPVPPGGKLPAGEIVLRVPMPDSGDRAQMASDGFHPSAVGYRLWADSLAAAIVPALVAAPSLSAGRPASAVSASTR